jgi:glycine cleavage system transcriptional repressor
MRFPFPKRNANRPAMNTEAENDCLAITACGEDQIGLVERLTGRIADSGCNVEESRMSVLGGKFALIALVTGPWHALSKLEAQLPALGEQFGLAIVHERTTKKESRQQAIPYNVELVTMDQPGIVRSLSAFFARQGINIEELQTSTYAATQTGTPMLSLVMTVGIPSNVHIATLRGDFLDYCDNLNLDATFEPVRG